MPDEGRVEHGVRHAAAAPEGRLGAELFQHQLLDGIVENTPAGADAALTRRADQFVPEARNRRRAPCQADARRKSLVVSLGHTVGDSRVAGENQAEREHGIGGAVLTAIGRSELRDQRIIGRKLARINLGHLPRTESLHVMPDVSQRRIQFPAQAIVQRQVRANLPAILREQVERRAAHIFVLRRSLRVRIRQAQKEIRIKIVGAHIIGTAGGERVRTVDVVVKRLVEAHAAHIHAEFQAVSTHDLAEAVRPLKTVADLRQLALEIVADGEAAGGADRGHAFVIRSQIRRDSILRVGRVGETIGGRHGGPANILDELRVLRMVVVKLAFAEVSEARFVDQGGRGRPCLAQVELLVARSVDGSESRHVGARGFKVGKGLLLGIVIEVVIEAQLVVVADMLVEPEGGLNSLFGLVRHRLVGVEAAIG